MENTMTKEELTIKLDELVVKKDELQNLVNESENKIMKEVNTEFSYFISVDDTTSIKANSVYVNRYWFDEITIYIECEYILDDFHKKFDLRIQENNVKFTYLSIPNEISLCEDLNTVKYLSDLSKIMTNKEFLLDLYKLFDIESFDELTSIIHQISDIKNELDSIAIDDKHKEILSSLAVDQVYTYPNYSTWFYRIIKITDKKVICKELNAYSNYVNGKFEEIETYHTHAIRHIDKTKFINMIMYNTSQLVENDYRNREVE